MSENQKHYAEYEKLYMYIHKEKTLYKDTE